jgi:hypothetical protein
VSRYAFALLLVTVALVSSVGAASAQRRRAARPRTHVAAPATPEVAAPDATTAGAEAAPVEAPAQVEVSAPVEASASEVVEPTDAAPTEAVPDAPTARVIAPPAGWRVRTRHDTVLSWSPRYMLSTTQNELGLEQQLWLAVDPLPLYHRASLDASRSLGPKTSFAMHLSGWGSVDLLQAENGGQGAGDIAIGYVELAHKPLSIWAGRRFLTFGPPGGLHVDGVGVGARTGFGLFVEAFAGRPVTPMRLGLLGPQGAFVGPTAAYGARVGFEDAGRISASAAYAELWSHGILDKRTVDVAATWDPGILQLEGSVKIDALNPGIMQARAVALFDITHELEVDANYLHIEPQRWIAAWSILSAFETSTFDEAMAGVTVRLSRSFAVRGEGAARVYSMPEGGDTTIGYRADVSARMMPGADHGPALRLQASRRDDGDLRYTVLTAGASLDVYRGTYVSLDGAFAGDDDGKRPVSAIGRGSVDLDLLENLRLGATVSFGTTLFAETELRAMLRLRWLAEVSE